MILVRNVFQAKFGRGEELVALVREALGTMSDKYALSSRVLSDLSGSYSVVILEFTVKNMAAWEAMVDEQYTIPQFENWFARMILLVESGSREFLRIEM